MGIRFGIDLLLESNPSWKTSSIGFLTNDAVLHAPESRTSSPILIPRNPETMEHVSTKGLFPCAEGAGYAGGIVSAAIDGMNCVDAIITSFQKEV